MASKRIKCIGKNIEGRRCSRFAELGHAYCEEHAQQWAVQPDQGPGLVEEMVRCLANRQDGSQCRAQALAGSRLCGVHNGLNKDRILCTARKRDGGACKALAIKGATVCRAHGGKLPSHQKAATRRLALLRSGKAVDRLQAQGPNLVDTDPQTELLLEVRRSATMVRWWERELMREAPDVLASAYEEVVREGELPVNRFKETRYLAQVSVVYKLWLEERNQLVRVSRIAMAAGVAERQVRLVEEQGAMMARLFTDYIEQMEAAFGWQSAQVEQARRMAAGQLRMLPAPAPAVVESFG